MTFSFGESVELDVLDVVDEVDSLLFLFFDECCCVFWRPLLFGLFLVSGGFVLWVWLLQFGCFFLLCGPLSFGVSAPGSSGVFCR